MHVLILATLAAMAAARPSFIAVPADQIAFVDLRSLHIRRPRQVLTPPQLPQAFYQQQEYPIPVLQQYQQLQQQPVQYRQLEQQHYLPVPVETLLPPSEPEAARTAESLQEPLEAAPLRSAAARLSERPADFGEYVDFGAHTGDNGAFGWYADYPINNHDDGFRR